MAYYSVEPFGEERADLRTGILSSVIANVNRDPKRHPRPYVPHDFMPPSVDRPSTAPPSAGPVDPATLTAAFKAVYKKKKPKRVP